MTTIIEPSSWTGRKAEFIHQVVRGELVDREIDGIGDDALSASEIKALATGNPLILKKAGLDNEVAKLRRLRRTHAEADNSPRTRIVSAVDLQPGNIVTNLGVVDKVRRDGVFVVAAVRGTVWSLATATGDVHTLDVIWHDSQELTVDVL